MRRATGVSSLCICSVGRATGAFRTRYGWHVAYVIEELPAKDRSFEDVRDELARDFLPAAKRARAKEIIDGLYGAADVILLEENAPADAGDLP